MVASRKKRAPEVETDDPLYSEALWLLRNFKKHVDFVENAAQLYQWATQGVTNRLTRERVYLEVVRVPQGRATSTAAMMRFLQNLNRTDPRPETKSPKKNDLTKAGARR